MKKLILFFPFLLFAFMYPDFRPCYEKFAFIKNSVPVTKNRSVTFCKKRCVFYDPFTGMCVINSKNTHIVNFLGAPKLGWWAASVKKDEIYVGNVAKKEMFFIPAMLSVKTPENSVVTDMFCRAVGIGRGDGFIDGGMVMHFVKYGYWGDVGIDVNEDMKISSFDPFYVKGIKTGEKIVSINGKKATLDRFMKYVTEGVEGRYVKLKINSRIFKIKIRKKIYNFTPLVHFGIYVNKNLIITKLPENIKKRYYLTKGAKIIKINNHKISSFNQLKKLLSTYKNVTISLMQQGIVLNIPLR